jgi:hypothetical protein
MVELKQKNPDFVTQEELEKFLNDYEDYIYKFQNINNDQQRFLFFLKKHRDIIEDVIKGISKIQLNVYAVTSINDHHFDFRFQDDSLRTKSNTLRGDVIIETWNKSNLNQLKFALNFKINQKESFNYTADLSTLTFGGRWVPGIFFEKFYNYVPDNIQEGDKILFNINIHTPFTSGGSLSFGFTYHRFNEIELLQVSSDIITNNKYEDPNFASKSSWMKKFGPRWIFIILILFTGYKSLLYFKSNKKNNYEDGRKLRNEYKEEEILRIKNAEDLESKINEGDPIYIMDVSDDDKSKGYYEFINFDGLGHTIGKLYYGKYQIGSIRRVWKDDISGLGKSELEIMQNEIYARHGLIFKSSKAKSYFKSQKWYKPKFENVDKFLSDIEKFNLQYIEIMKVQLSD